MIPQAIASVSLAILAAGGLAGPAAAAKEKRPRATISSCTGAEMTIAADVVARKADNVARAKLELQFAVVPERGAVRRGKWLAIGRKRAVVRSQRFRGLPSGPWSGTVRYRWRRGGKTVVSGVVRTEKARIGSKTGRGACVLTQGVGQQVGAAVDRDPPTLTIIPAPDLAWKRGPVTVTFIAVDGSGVGSVDYTVNGAPGQGRTLTLTSQGEYDIRATARDLVGNVSPEASTFIRIDGTPPTAPVVTLPDPASDNTPRVQWTQSSDGESGVQGYVVSVTSGGQAVQSQQVGPATQELTLSKLTNGPYSVQVSAFDGTQTPPFVTSSTPKDLPVDNVVYRELFGGGCPGYAFTIPGDFLSQNPWQCSANLASVTPRQCPSGSTYTAASPQLSYVATPGETMRLSFDSALEPGTVGGTRRVDVMVGNTSIANTSGTSVTYTEPASQPSLLFTHSLATGGFVACTGASNSSVNFDNLQLERNP